MHVYMVIGLEYQLEVDDGEDADGVVGGRSL
jgi:hypothetical protein